MITKVYEDRDKFIAALKSYDYLPDKIRTILRHEDAHFNKALELGYKPQYLLLLTDDEAMIQPGVTLDRKASKDDLIAMLSAPEILSESDRAKILSLTQKNPREEEK